MGSKLDQTHSDLSRIASALQEAKQKKPKFKAGSPKEKKGKGPGRKKRKQQNTQDKLYQGQEPVKSKSGRQIPIGEPFRTPASRPARPAPAPIEPVARRRAQTPRTPLPATVSTRPSTAVPTTPPTAAKEAPKTPEKPRVPLKPRIMTEPTGGNLKARETFLQRVKRAVTGRRRDAGISEPGKTAKKSLPRRAFSAFKRVAGMFKRKILGEGQLPRTLIAMSIVEERSSTTFKKCPKGAMVSTARLRHSLPKNMFVNPDKDNPTFPIRSGCRSSKAGVLRALQKDMSGAGEGTVKQVLQRMNAQGGTRGKDKLKAWGTGVGGKRMNTFRGKPHTPKRTASLAKRLGISRKKASKLHGVSTGRPDMVKHTSPYSPVGGSKGPAGNREVARSPMAHAKTRTKQSKRKEKRKRASAAVTIGRGKALAGR